MSGVRELAQRAKRASRVLAQLGTDEKNSLLVGMADELDALEKVIRKANQEDVTAARVAGTSGALLDRLELSGNSPPSPHKNSPPVSLRK